MTTKLAISKVFYNPKMYNKAFIFTTIFAFAVSSCTSSKQINSEKSICNENLNFKKIFFQKIQNVETFMTKYPEFKSIEDLENYYTAERIDMFKSSLLYISKYSKVSYESMLNYDQSYPIGEYEKDKKNWLKWYDENKCTNIQFEDSILSK